MSMDTDEPKFVQAAPEALGKSLEGGEEKVVETAATARSGWGRPLREDELDEDGSSPMTTKESSAATYCDCCYTHNCKSADGFLTWVTRYPVERNHPRPTTGTVDVKKSGDAVVTSTTDKLSDVLQKLIVEGFLSMPVISSVDNRLVGYIDMLDIVWYTLWSFGAWREEVSTEKILESKEHFSTFLSLERFRNATVMDVLGRPGFGTYAYGTQNTGTAGAGGQQTTGASVTSSKLQEPVTPSTDGWLDGSVISATATAGTRNAPHHVYKGFSLFYVFESMARMSAHRMAICNSERKVVGLVTQSMIISLLDQHMDRLGTLATNHTVAEMIPGLFDELKLVNETDLALTAFKSMVQSNVNGLAVVNAAGELVDGISVRDLRGMGTSADEWTTLWMSVKEFKAHCRKRFAAQTPATPIYAVKTDTLESVIKKMDDGNIHRVFVAEEKDGKPIPTHCISQRDVLRFLLHLSGLKSTSLEDLERAQELS